MLNLLDGTWELVSIIMKYVLIGTIVLGCIFVLIFAIMIIKKLRYTKQVSQNRKERNKLIKSNKEQEESEED